MNLGSKMIIDATRKTGRESKIKNGMEQIHYQSIGSFDQRIIDVNLIENVLLIVKVRSALSEIDMNTQPLKYSSSGKEILKKLVNLPELSTLKIIATVSEDVDIHDRESYIWGIFTRFDCERDVIFKEQNLMGISPTYSGVMGIDATWKPGYPEPLKIDEDIIKLVDEKWERIWKK